MEPIVRWLEGLGLGKYAPAFAQAAIDPSVLPDLTEADLEKLGVLLGHRKKLLRAIAALHAPGAMEASVPPFVPTGPIAADAERRQVTVMFCDLVGSTELALRLDPEDLHEVIGRYHPSVAATVARFGGFVAKYMGDGVLSYFGYPQAHEDDAEQAVRAGLALVGAVGEIRAPERLRVRVGIATGLVVVGDLIGAGSAQEQAIVGETPNLAARLQALAEPGTVVIAAGTRRLIGRLFEYRELGPVALRGFPNPVPVWQVLKARAIASRFEARHEGAFTPLVGRWSELNQLVQSWDRARAGDGGAALVAGEPGIGKSRIVRELQCRLEGEPHLRLRYYCSPHNRDTALHPFIAHLERAAEFVREDPPEIKLAKLEDLLTQSNASEVEVGLIAGLLSVPTGERFRLPEMAPQRRKEKTLDALVAQLSGLAQRQPVLVVYEDLHWSDPTSLELLTLLVPRMAHIPGLLLLTARPEFVPPWTNNDRVMQLSLARLNRQEGITIMEGLTGGKLLPADVLDQILTRTDGVPLFIEELTKAVLESGLLHEGAEGYLLKGTLPPFAIPTTLQDSLMARLDQLGAGRELAQVGAVIGREFSYELIRAVMSDALEEELRASLDELVAAGLVLYEGVPPDELYTFKHALIQDAAYAMLLRGKRQQLHFRIAHALENWFPEKADTEPELLAHHYQEAGLAEPAMRYWRVAGRLAADRSAMTEAIAQLRKALGLLPELLDDSERLRQELEIHLVLGKALVAAKGYAALETGCAYTHARQLSEQVGDSELLFATQYGQFAHHFVRAELKTCLTIGEDMLRLGRVQNSMGGQSAGHRVIGSSLLFRGDFAAAREHLERGLATYDPSDDVFYASFAAQDIRVGISCFLATTLCYLGYPDQSATCISRALARARELSHPYSLVYALTLMGGVYFSLRRPQQLSDVAEEAERLATIHGFPYFRLIAETYRGGCLALAGQPIDGIPLLRDGMRALQTTGAAIGMPLYGTMLALAYAHAGQVDDALRQIDEMLAHSCATGEGWYDSELYRLKGAILTTFQTAEAETCFQRSITVAHEQHAMMWELRASVSLARLWRYKGRCAEARNLLAPICSWFTEGFDAPDLVNAKALLDELAVH